MATEKLGEGEWQLAIVHSLFALTEVLLIYFDKKSKQ